MSDHFENSNDKTNSKRGKTRGKTWKASGYMYGLHVPTCQRMRMLAIGNGGDINIQDLHRAFVQGVPGL